MRLDVRSHRREQMIDITQQVREVVDAAHVRDGAAVVYCRHTTAGITINEAADPAVAADILARLAELAPHHWRWQHDEGNSDAHVKATLVGASALIPFAEGQLLLGTWQGIFFCEFDGPRSRSVTVTILPAERS